MNTNTYWFGSLAGVGLPELSQMAIACAKARQAAKTNSLLNRSRDPKFSATLRQSVVLWEKDIRMLADRIIAEREREASALRTNEAREQAQSAMLASWGVRNPPR